MTFFQKIDNFIAGFGVGIPNGPAQLLHFGITYAIVFTAYVVGWAFNFWQAGIITSFAIGVVWGLWKEAYRDTLPPENAPFFWNGAKDLAFYWGGILAATYVTSALGMAFPG